jgi:hypothetical protein
MRYGYLAFFALAAVLSAGVPLSLWKARAPRRTDINPTAELKPGSPVTPLQTSP